MKINISYVRWYIEKKTKEVNSLSSSYSGECQGLPVEAVGLLCSWLVTSKCKCPLSAGYVSLRFTRIAMGAFQDTCPYHTSFPPLQVEIPRARLPFTLLSLHPTTQLFCQSWLQHPGFSVKVSLKSRRSQVESKSSITFLGFAETSARDAFLSVCGLWCNRSCS